MSKLWSRVRLVPAVLLSISDGLERDTLCDHAGVVVFVGDSERFEGRLIGKGGRIIVVYWDVCGSAGNIGSIAKVVDVSAHLRPPHE